MSQQTPDTPGRQRRDRVLLILVLSIGAVLTLAFVLALVVHVILLRTDRFDWLEAPKRSSLTSAARPA